VVIDEKVFKECPIVVIVMAACAGTAFKGQILMAFPVIADVGVTVKTVILWQGYPHRGSDFFLVLGVTADAIAGVYHTEPVCIARIGKFLFWVRIVSLCQFRSMAADTGLLNQLGTAKGLGMAAAAGQFYLEVAVTGLANQKCLFIVGFEQDITVVTCHGEADKNPCGPDEFFQCIGPAISSSTR